jgi:arsenite-transporting ATPase
VRILLFSGKGGVGKTSLAAATAIRLARQGRRTLVMSVDPAHSLADAFALECDLFSRVTADPVPVADRLWLQEVNIQTEVKRHWQDVSSYVTSVLRTTGLGEVEAEELAILPGMEELSAMMYVNQYHREQRFDVVILDCAPTAESLRFVSMPTTLEWYMRHIFPAQRAIVKAVRPVVNRVAPVELPPDEYFANVQTLFRRLEGVADLLEDPDVTSVRLITNAERVVLRETQRAYVYFALHGLTVDSIIVNRVLPDRVQDEFFAAWHRTANAVLYEVDAYFAPIPVKRVPLFEDEVLGYESLERMAATLYGEGDDPAAVTRRERAFVFEKNEGGRYLVRVLLPFAAKADVSVFKKGDELVVEIGTLRRHIGLPTSLAALQPTRANLENGVLRVHLEPTP